jgi:hypothetical protein
MTYIIIHGKGLHRHKIQHNFKTKANAQKYIKEVLMRKGTKGSFVNPRVKKVEK